MFLIDALSNYVKPTSGIFLSGLVGYVTAVKNDTTIEQWGATTREKTVQQQTVQTRIISAQISDLRSDKYQFDRPLPVTISEEDNLSVVNSYDLNLFGYGETEDEAIQDLCEAIVEYYDDLEKNKMNLGKIPTRDKHFLDQIIKRCN